jgi:hypothetical protein
LQDENQAIVLFKVLQEMVDEARYCFTPVGKSSWNILIIRLGQIGVATKILATIDDCQRFLERFNGDADALVAGIESLLTAGTDLSHVKLALLASNTDIATLVEDWNAWNVSFGLRYQSKHTATVLKTLIE